jgi:hypothetical protein
MAAMVAISISIALEGGDEKFDCAREESYVDEGFGDVAPQGGEGIAGQGGRLICGYQFERDAGSARRLEAASRRESNLGNRP